MSLPSLSNSNPTAKNIFSGSSAVSYTAIGLVFFLSLWWVVLRPLGGLASIPGDLCDTRFNSVILEHFYRWVLGLDKSFWNAAFFYPFSFSIGFSDNLLGSAPFYALFRWAGADRDTALQYWYILGYCLNFAAAAFVLTRARFSWLAVSAGAFFFTFGLPMLAQETHVQLLYRFSVPLAGYFLWRWAQKPAFKFLALVVFFLVYQFFTSIYTGYFLLLLLGALALVIPFGLLPGWKTPRAVRAGLRDYLLFWPRRIQQTWACAGKLGQVLELLLIVALLAALLALFIPYLQVTQLYNFKRSWDEVSQMMPGPRSYLIADQSLIWQTFSARIGHVNMRNEHQLFPGLAIVLTLALGTAWRFRSENRALAFVYLAALLLLVAVTLQFRYVSLYKLLWLLPGINSIRAVTRVQLIMMWPMAFFAAYTIDALLTAASRGKLLRILAACLLLALLLCESVFFTHTTFSKQVAQDRLSRLNSQLPKDVPDQPILALAINTQEPFWISEIDAMLIAQQHGWATINGYSGNFPPGYEQVYTCGEVANRYKRYQDFTGRYNQTAYLNYLSRVVLIGFSDCDSTIWRGNLSITQYQGAFPPDLLPQIAIEAVSLTGTGQKVTASFAVRNNSTQPLPAQSSTGNPFRVILLPINVDSGQTMPDYKQDFELDFDLQPRQSSVLNVEVSVPKEAGRYQIVAWPIQVGVSSQPESVAGLAASPQNILVDQNSDFSVVDSKSQK